MRIVHGFTRADEHGRIAIPMNIARAARLQTGELVEVKDNGPVRYEQVVIHKLPAAKLTPVEDINTHCR